MGRALEVLSVYTLHGVEEAFTQYRW